MKNLVAIIGSPRGYNSNTYKIAFKILQELRNRNIEILPKFFILSELEINKCIGCAKCFFNASSCVSFRDSMDEVEKALLESDLIIFGSPVYAHNATVAETLGAAILVPPGINSYPALNSFDILHFD